MKIGLTYFCYAQNYWGRGKTPTEARKNAREGGMSENAMWILLASDDEGIGVNGLGELMVDRTCWYARVGWFRGSRLLARDPEKQGE